LNTLSRCKPMLGTYVEISVSGKVSNTDLIKQSEAAFAAISKIHHTMSFHCPDSELSKMNRLAIKAPFEVSEPMLKVLQLADRLHKATKGLFDLSIAPKLIALGHLPSQPHWTEQDLEHCGTWSDIELRGSNIEFKKPLLLDLGGIAKGLAVDQAIQTVSSDVSIVVNAGGDIAMSRWENQTIDIKHCSGKLIEVTMIDAAVASSSSYYNAGNSNIINPLIGQASKSEDTFSAFAPSCMIADAMTKVAYLMNQNVKPIAQTFGAVTLRIDNANHVYL
jgi:thiamine biosynthesis lipoprotein